jgi:hypothetical protein
MRRRKCGRWLRSLRPTQTASGNKGHSCFVQVNRVNWVPQSLHKDKPAQEEMWEVAEELKA